MGLWNPGLSFYARSGFSREIPIVAQKMIVKSNAINGNNHSFGLTIADENAADK